jgi:hypothetical protein
MLTKHAESCQIESHTRALFARFGENKSLLHFEIERRFADQLIPIDRNTL